MHSAAHMFSSYCYQNQRKHESCMKFSQRLTVAYLKDKVFLPLAQWMVIILGCFLDLHWKQCTANCFQLYYWASSGQCWATPTVTDIKGAEELSAYSNQTLWAVEASLANFMLIKQHSVQISRILTRIRYGGINSLWLTLSATVDNGCTSLLSHVWECLEILILNVPNAMPGATIRLSPVTF